MGFMVKYYKPQIITTNKKLRMKKQTQIIQILVILLVLLIPMLLMAQPVGNPYGTGGGDPDAAPIDGGLSLLVAAGVGYGAKKLKERRQKRTTVAIKAE